MISHIYGSTSSAPSTTATNYNSVNSTGTGSWQTNEAFRAEVAPHTFTLDVLRIKLTTAPGGATNYTFTVMQNGVATAITAQVSGVNTTAQDLTHSITVNAGDRISIRCTPGGGTPGSTGVLYWSMRQTASNAFAVMGINVGSSTGTNFQVPQGRALIASTDALAQIIMPTAGMFTNLNLYLAGAIGSAGNGYTATLFKNNVATTLTCTQTTGAVGGASDSTHSVSVVAGDVISIQIVAVGTVVSIVYSTGLTFAPTNDGESFLSFANNGNATSASATQYNQAMGADTTWNATENTRFTLMQACTLTGIYADTSVSPGVSPKQYTFTGRQNSTNTAAAITINDASSVHSGKSDRYGGTVGLSIALADDDTLDTQSVPSGSPGTLFAKHSYLLFVTSGGTAYTSSLTAALSFTGAENAQTMHGMAAALSFTGAIARAIAHLQTGTLSSTGSLTKQTNHVLPAAAVSFSGNVVKITGKNLVATITFSGAISRAIRHVFTAGVSFTGAMARTVRRNLAAALSFEGAIAKSTSRALAGVLSFTGTITKGAIHFLSLAGTLSFTGVFNKNTQKNIGGVLSETGLMQRSTQRNLAANTTFTGSIAKRTARALTATISFAGTFTKGAFHAMALTATVAFNGVFARSTNKSFAATTTPAGTVSRRTNRALSAAVSYTGAFSKRVGRQLAATLSYTGSITRRAGRSLGASLSFTGAVAKQAQHKLTGGLGHTGAISKRTARNMSASTTPSGQIKRNIKKSLTGAVSYTGSVTRTTLRALTASVGFVGNLVTRLIHIFRSTPTRPIYLGQKNERLGIGQKPSITELGQSNNNTHLNQNPQTRTTDDNNDDSLLPM